MKSALITGGATRLGREIAKFLYSKGYKVIIHYNTSEEEAINLVQQINCRLVKADLEKEDDIERLISNCGKVDLLVNSAAMFKKDILGNLNEALKLQHYKVNFLAPKRLIQGLAGINKRLMVVNLLDAWAESNPLGFEGYYRSKQQLKKFTEAAKGNFPDLKVYGIMLGATLIKEGQKQKVFDEVAKNYSTEIKTLLSAIEEVIICAFESGMILDISKGKHIWKRPKLFK
jgi:pteridine reductase